MLSFVKDSPQSKRYQELAGHHHRGARLHARLRHRSGSASGDAHDRFLHQPRGAAARLRAGFHARQFDDRRLVLHQRPHAVGRRPHPAAGSRPCRVLPRHQESARTEDRPDAEAGRAAQAHRHPRSGQRARPPHADLPHGRRQGRRTVAAARARGQARGPQRGVVVRSDARQHHHLGDRLQDAAVRSDPQGGARRFFRCMPPKAPMPAACIWK